MIEGAGFILLQQAGWLTPLTGMVDVSTDITWFAALFNMLLFGAAGAVLAAISRVFPKLPLTAISAALLFLLATLSWLSLSLYGRAKWYAVLALGLGATVQFYRWFRKHEQASIRLCRKSLLWLLVLVLAIFIVVEAGSRLKERTAASALAPAPAESPNVVLIVIDTLRSDHLTIHGYGRPTSPNLDRIARQGVIFENAYAASSWTLPSHVSLFTGRYANEHKAEWNNSTALVDAGYPTLAEALQSRGYRTGGFSGNLYWVTRRFGFARGFIHFEDYSHSIGDRAVRTIYGRAIETLLLQRIGFEDIPARRRASDINASVLRWIDEDRKTPFFVFINYMDVHDPYLPPQPFRSKFSDVENPGGLLNWRLGRNDLGPAPEKLEDEISAYDGAIAYVDEQIGRLIAEFEKRGLGENTLFVITSDHGEMLGEHGLFLHGNSLHRKSIQVPLFISLRGRVPSDLSVRQPVSNAGVASTIMELVGAGDQGLFPSPSLARLWEQPGSKPDWPAPVSYLAQQDWVEPNLPVHHGWSRSVVDAEWHYIENEKLGVELYRVEDDSAEVNNLADRPEFQSVITGFRERFLESSLFSHDSSFLSRPFRARK
ncbi:MAG TPA: sulfatase [Blastocatellia bacterium]|nr:sulfatase [Blastocatellia bacterium]